MAKKDFEKDVWGEDGDSEDSGLGDKEDSDEKDSGNSNTEDDY